MGRPKKGDVAKNQAVISRFFAPAAAPQGEVSPIVSPSHFRAGTVEWPPSGRRTPQKRALQCVQGSIEAENGEKMQPGSSEAGSQTEEAAAHNRASKRLKVREDVAEVAADIPPLEPARHQKFVRALAALSDKQGSGAGFYGKPPSGNEKHTPLEQQVVELKARYSDVLLMVEVGYKFRFFGEDAETAARVLGIIAHYSHSFLTASIPTFRLHVHVRRLVEAGYKVGVVKQTETAAIKAHGANKSGPFTRGLSALYTKATLEAGEFLGGDEVGEHEAVGRLSSYIMCVVEESVLHENYDSRFGVVAVEAATGDIMHGYFMDNVMRTELESRLLTCAPAELLITSSLSSVTERLLLDYAGPASEVRVEKVSQESYGSGGAAAAIAEFYGRKSFSKQASADGNANEGLEALMAMPELVVAAFAHILCYLKQFNLENVLRLSRSFRPFVGQQEIILSPNTLRQLEILKNNNDGTENGSLFWLMNHTYTVFGARMLRYWITHPCRELSVISDRLDAVAEISSVLSSSRGSQSEGSFPGSSRGGGAAGASSRGCLENQGLLASALLSLGKLPDLERGITRIYHKTATTLEFITVIQALVGIAGQFQRLVGNEDLSSERQHITSALLRRLLEAATSARVVDSAQSLLASLNATAATAGDKLNLFVHGQFPEVDSFRDKIKTSEEELEGLLPQYRKLLKLPTLQFLSVSGVSFLVEVPCAVRVPSDWLNINSTKKTHRYHPPEVVEAMERLALAREELNVACTRAWEYFLTEFAAHYVDFRAAVRALAALDCLHSLAVVSCNQGYIRPDFVRDQERCRLEIQAGRHPVLDVVLQNSFVPNDTFLNQEAERCQIITGPNMGGKSCYIRQVALITIMAQIGSFVPAASAKLHVFDSIYTRMGASDSIQRGSSTFLEELSEASAILNKATERSLVIMDELGRGTSTHDGVALAYATLHHLLQQVRCFTLFVTHYPSVAELVQVFPREVQAYHVSYLADSQDPGSSNNRDAVTFLYKLRPGAASRSFGIHVARLAMLPETCVRNASVVAAKFENDVKSRELERLLLLIQRGCLQGSRVPIQDAQRQVKKFSDTLDSS